MTVQADDRLLVSCGPVDRIFPVPLKDCTLRRFLADGAEDTNFSAPVFDGPFSLREEVISNVALLPEGKALIAGGFPSLANEARGYLVRIHLGEPLPPAPPVLIDGPESIGALPGQTANFRVNADAVGPLRYQWFFQGQPLAGQTSHTLVVTNVSPGAEGDYSVAVENIAGSLRSAPVRLTIVPAPGGSVDPRFDPGTGAEDGPVNALLLEPDGRILVGGTFTRFNGAPRRGLVRLNPDGSMDEQFNAGRPSAGAEPVAQLTVHARARQTDGRILFAGALQQVGEAGQTNVFRLKPDGTLDGSFQVRPAHPPHTLVVALAALPDASVLVGGRFIYTNAQGSTIGGGFRSLVRLDGWEQ